MSVATEPEADTRWRTSLGEWLAAITVLLAVLGMAISTPALAGPDEPAHQGTASYLTAHIWPPAAETEAPIAGILKFGACMAFDSAKDASCGPDRTDLGAGKVRILNYPPPYYWVVGLGQKMAPGADDWMDVGGRIASLLLNLAGLTLLALMCRRRCRSWGTTLLLVAPPMAVFLWAVVNPGGWQITTGLIFGFLFARAWWNSDVLGPVRTGWPALIAVAAASLALALSRHDAIMWMVLLVIAIMLMGRSALDRKDQAKVLLAIAPGLVAGLVWQLTHPAQHIDHNPDRLADPQVSDYLHWLGQIDAYLPERIRQMVGVPGWLDTPVPQTFVIVLLVSWAAFIGFLYARTRVPAAALLVGFLGTFVIPSVMEMLRWNDWPYWYQGRITLSFTLPFLFVFVLRFGRHGTRAATLLSLLSAAVLTFMVWQNVMRYAFGVTDYIPVRWDSPAIGRPWYVLSLIVVAAMVCITATRAGMFAADRRQRPTEGINV